MPPNPDPSKLQTPNLKLQQIIYLCLSFLVPMYYGWITLHYVGSQEYIVQDDMRQHVVWFQRWLDPSIFQNDAIARYYGSVAPVGVATVYWLAAQMGIEPLFLAKLLPLPLAFITTGYLFYTTLTIVPSPLAAWLATLMLNQHLWLNDDLVSATPRAFVYPLFAAFLYYLVRRSTLPLLAAIALLGLCFPQMMLVAVAVLIVQLVEWQNLRNVRLWLTRDRQRWWVAGWGLLVASAIALPFALNLSEYGDAITVAQMRSQLEYGLGGRNEYFGVDPISFILHGSSGLRIPVFPSIIWAGFALPWLRTWSTPTLQTITPRMRVLLDLLVASLGLFFLAHLLLLRLYFPSRYTYHSWRFILAIAAGIVLAALIEKGTQHLIASLPSPSPSLGEGFRVRALKQSPSPSLGEGFRVRALKPWLKVSLAGFLAAIVIGIPMFPPLMVAFQGWVIGELPPIYTYLQRQPPDTLVASLAPEASNIPAFTHRSTWTAREFSLAHHPQYYAMISDRTAALLQAQYSPDLADVQQFVANSGVDFFLVERNAFEPEYLHQDWLFNSVLRPQAERAIAQLRQGIQPALAQHLSLCTVVSTEHYILADAQCF